MNSKKKLCTCGKTKTPPFCDHSHDHTESAPAKKQLCTCGKTKAPPFCNHSHKSLAPLAIEKAPVHRKILLIILPYWSPLNPPHGIAHLKNFLQHFGYTVKAIDANVEVKFKQLLYKYFSLIKEMIPENKRGNYYNIGNDVLREHMMAHINHQNQQEYIELVQLLIYKNFYWDITLQQAGELNNVLKEFYFVLEHYILDLLASENPAVLGISVFRDTLPASVFSFKLCRERYPHIKTVMGGGIFTIQLPPGSPNLEFFLEKTKDYIDKIIVGRGERAFLQYLQSLQRLEIVTDTDIRTQMDSIADVPDLSDFDLKLYQYIGAFGSTGCPFNCSFCNVESFFGQYRKKAASKTVEEMIQLHKKYGTRLFFMFDELLNPIITDLSKELIKRDVSLYWDAYFRVDEAATHMENTILWRRAGFYRARIGIESGSQRVLDLINKRATVEQAKATLINLANAGIKTTVYIVIGHPGETEADFQMTLDFVENLKEFIWEAECNPFTYFYSGQPKNDEWAGKRELLYPESTKDMLMYQTWIVAGEPSREVTYQRVNRFVEHCKKLEISVTWSLADVNKADKRWKKLHQNAVPSILDLTYKQEQVLGEAKEVKVLNTAQNPHPQEEHAEFGF
jgi:radical SAM superfamily enzyme YgiQ (UPF0313 family)/CDGSH-type Zn-finger protein